MENGGVRNGNCPLKAALLSARLLHGLPIVSIVCDLSKSRYLSAISQLTLGSFQDKATSTTRQQSSCVCLCPTEGQNKEIFKDYRLSFSFPVSVHRCLNTNFYEHAPGTYTITLSKCVCSSPSNTWDTKFIFTSIQPVKTDKKNNIFELVLAIIIKTNINISITYLIDSLLPSG